MKPVVYSCSLPENDRIDNTRQSNQCEWSRTRICEVASGLIKRLDLGYDGFGMYIPDQYLGEFERRRGILLWIAIVVKIGIIGSLVYLIGR